MKYFAGMDVSLEETAICVVDEAGRMIKEARAASEPDALHAVLASFNLVFERVGLEACSLAAWLHGELTDVGWLAGSLHRNASRESRDGRHAEQDRSQ